MAHSVVRYLQDTHHPERLDILCAPSVASLVARLPGVDAVQLLHTRHGQWGWRQRLASARTLRREHYDWALTLPNSWKSALAPALAGIPRRTGYVGEMRYGLLNDIRHLDRTALPRMVDRYLALAVSRDAPRPQAPEPRITTHAASARACLTKLGIGLIPAPILALCPGAEYGPAKRWPAAHFAEIAQTALARGWQVWLLGGPADRDVACAINSYTGDACQNLAGRTRLDEVLDLLSLASAVVTNDSGLMHIAAALERPVVALFGSSDPGHTPPLSHKARALSLQLACSPCFKRKCPLGHLRCLNALTPATASKALSSLVPELWSSDQT